LELVARVSARQHNRTIKSGASDGDRTFVAFTTAAQTADSSRLHGDVRDLRIVVQPKLH